MYIQMTHLYYIGKLVVIFPKLKGFYFTGMGVDYIGFDGNILKIII